MEDNSTNMRLKQAGKILVRPESWGLELLFAIALYAIGLMLSGKDMIDAIDLAWLTLLNFITSPLALFFMAIGAPIIFWKGVNKVIVNEGAMMAAQSVRDEALRERALQEALSLFRYPALQAKKELLEIRRSRFQQALYKVNESKGLYSTFIDKARSGALSDNRKDQLCAQIQVALSPLCDAKMCLAAVCGTENL